jgi:hypothetical protein
VKLRFEENSLFFPDNEFTMFVSEKRCLANRAARPSMTDALSAIQSTMASEGSAIVSRASNADVARASSWTASA